MDIESSTTLSPHVHQESTNPAPDMKHRGGWRAIKYIIANESFEKLASMSLIGNLSVYLTTKYNLGGVFLVNIINIWKLLTDLRRLSDEIPTDVKKSVGIPSELSNPKRLYNGHMYLSATVTWFVGIPSENTDGIPTTLLLIGMSSEFRRNIPTNFRRLQRLRFVEKAAVITDPNELNEEGKAKNNWRLCSVEQVKNLKCVTGILPVWVTGIACFMLTDQQNIYGILQAIQMEKTFGHNFQVPAGWMNLVSMITLAVWISLYECVILPIARQITGRKQRLNMKQRIQIGIVMGIACMLVAGFLEKARREAALKKGSFVSPVSIVVLLPQFMLAGLTEAFSAVALMEFLTVKMPEHMRAVAGAIFFLSSSIASYICTLLINVIDSVTRKEGRSWLGDKDLNKNRLEYYFFIIGGVQVLNLLYFRFFASRFVTENNKDNRDF
ncbi:hypothetical protein F2Q70_00018588 [Brassica cretica]|uniref:Uncharacterized protein n=1 Tax=Brassica cretica TaxID=69181 RepID=A0A8S9I1N1_BRACR|nr:hypothetical protein F2Q70_00018588 [Brassica cretica]